MIKMTNKNSILTMQNFTKQATSNGDATTKKVFVKISVTAVTTVTECPIMARGSGSASIAK